MPRILFIVPSEYEALKAKGVDKMIFERDENGFFERVLTIHPIAERNRVIELNNVFVLHEFGFGVFGRAYRSRLSRMFFSPFHFARVLGATLRLVYKERIDIIRATDPFWMGLLALATAKLSGRPLCVSIHADYNKRQQLTGGGDVYTFFGIQWPANLICKLVLSSSDMVMPVRESLRTWAISKGAHAERIRVIPHGIDMETIEDNGEYDPYTIFGIPEGRQIISFVGRISNDNYIFDVLEVARKLALHRNDFCLVIAGEGGQEGWLKESLAAEPGLRYVVRLVGFQPRIVCFALRRKSAVCLCLMGGFSLIESCLAGRPVISYDVEWHSEIVKTGYTGFLVRERDIDEVVRAVEQCLDEPAVATKLGEQAYNLVVLKHELKNTSQIKRNCYEELLRRM